MTPEIGVYRKALAVVAALGITVAVLGAGLTWVLAGPGPAVAAGLGGLLGIAVATAGPAAMLAGVGRSPAGLAGTVALGWAVSLGLAIGGFALARGLDDESRIPLAFTFLAAVVVGLAAKAVTAARGRVPYTSGDLAPPRA